MTKKEKENYEAAMTASALRTTCDVAPDVFPSQSLANLAKGWVPVASANSHARVEPACSGPVSHGIGQQEKTTSQRPICLYSTKLLALKALRREVERDCAQRLRKVDRMIEEENLQLAKEVK